MSTRRFLPLRFLALILAIFAITAGILPGLCADASPPAGISPAGQVVDVAPIATAIAGTSPSVPAVASVGVSGAAPAASSLWLSLIPLGVPVLVMFLKSLIPNLPRAWLPVIAAGVGLLLATLDHYTGALGGNPVAVLFLGAAGTGLREIGDQLRRVVTA